jgi:hypothetical protein
MFKRNIAVWVGLMASLSACQMMRSAPYNGFVGYQVLAQEGKSIQLRYSETDDLPWPSVTQKVTTACAAQLHLPVEQVRIRVQHTDTIQKEVTLTTATPIVMGRGMGVYNQMAGMTSIDLQTQDRAKRLFKQLDVVCSPR